MTGAEFGEWCRRSGLSLKEISALFEVSENTIYIWRRLAKVNHAVALACRYLDLIREKKRA
jgi:transposase-like protein